MRIIKILTFKFAKQHQKVITLEQNLIIWLDNKKLTLSYAKINNLHVMWNGNVIDPWHYKYCFPKLKMYDHFKKLHKKK
jgi:hypothetical protein